MAFLRTVCFIPVIQIKSVIVNFLFSGGEEGGLKIKTFAGIVCTDKAKLLRRLSVMALLRTVCFIIPVIQKP